MDDSSLGQTFEPIQPKSEPGTYFTAAKRGEPILLELWGNRRWENVLKGAVKKPDGSKLPARMKLHLFLVEPSLHDVMKDRSELKLENQVLVGWTNPAGEFALKIASGGRYALILDWQTVPTELPAVLVAYSTDLDESPLGPGIVPETAPPKEGQ